MNAFGYTCGMPEVELCIKLTNGDEILARYERPATAWLVRHLMLEQSRYGEFVQCIAGEIPARNVETVDFLCNLDEGA